MTMKKIAIVGSRDYYKKQESREVINRVLNELNLLYKDIEIVSGLARGADALGEEFANENGIVFHPFPADWETFGKSAGHIRNREMAEFSDIVIAFWDGKSRGTSNMISTSLNLGCEVWVWNYHNESLSTFIKPQPKGASHD